jgi:hypothetical protein
MWPPERNHNNGFDYVGFMPLILWWLGCSVTFTWLLFELS